MQIDIVSLITIFILAVFVGNEIINKVPPTLHTPLMSGSNAISGIAIVGAILAILVDAGDASKYIGLAAMIGLVAPLITILCAPGEVSLLAARHMFVLWCQM